MSESASDEGTANAREFVGRKLWDMPFDLLAVASTTGYFLELSANWENVLGYSTDELTSRPYLDFVHPDDVESTVAEVNALKDADHVTARFENRYRAKDGTYRWLSWSARRPEDGRSIYCIARDVTAQKDQQAADVAELEFLRDRSRTLSSILGNRTVEEIKASETRYRLLAENATDIVLQTDTDFQIRWASPSVEHVLGWLPEQLISEAVGDLVYPADQGLAALRRAAVLAGDILPVVEVRIKAAGGSYTWMASHARQLTDSDGQVAGVIIGLRDVHQEVLAREEASRVQAMFRLAMDGAPQGMAVTGLDLAFLQVNPALCAMLGRDEGWLLTHSAKDLIHPDDLEQELAGRADLLYGQGEALVRECRWLKSDGSEIWVMHSIGLYKDEEQESLFYISHVQDNTTAHRTRADLAFRATHDALTGLINREHVEERIAGVLSHSPRRGGVAGLLYCDLDHFKQINDTYGHAAGDHVLRTTAQRIVSVLRDTDVVARLGGDEFVVVLPEVYDIPAAVFVAEKVREAVGKPLALGDGFIDITISVGIALASPHVDSQQLLSNSDAALYQAKKTGRDRVVSFSSDQRGRPGR